jgi:hypothetical protein
MALANGAAAEKLLIPVFFRPQAPPKWGMDLFIMNHSTEPVRGSGVTFVVICPVPEGCRADNVPPRALATVDGADAPSGLVIEAADPTAVSVSARIFVTPSGVTLAGAQLPIARESAFSAAPLYFLEIPVNFGVPQEVRTHLRVYSLDPELVRVRAEIVDRDADLVLEAHEIDLAAGAAPAPPRFVFVDVDHTFSSSNSGKNLRVVPVARADGTVPRIWAFVTITSNTRNEVSVLSPQ